MYIKSNIVQDWTNHRTPELYLLLHLFFKIIHFSYNIMMNLIPVWCFDKNISGELWESKASNHVAFYMWSECGHDNPGSRVRSPDIHWPLFYLCYYCRVAKDYPKLLKTGPAMFICFVAVQQLSLSRTHHKRKNVGNYRRHYKNSIKKPEPLTGGGRLSISLHQCLPATKGIWRIIIKKIIK